MIPTPKISALAIVLNEEDNIRDYLNNMAFANEIIVVDSYSTDKTLEIIKAEYPKVKIYKRKFDDFSSQRNYAINLATNDWIVFFDADERLTEKGIQEIKNTVATDNKNVAFWVKRIFYYSGKPMHYGGKNQDKAIRLFKKSKCRYSKKLVHEQLIARGKTGILKESIHHYSFKSKTDFLNKRLQYSKLKAQELFEKGKEPNFFHYYIKPSFRFFKHYILEFGFLNGKNGVDLSSVLAYHVYMRYVFLNEMFKNKHCHKKTIELDENFQLGYEAKRIFHNSTGLGNYSRDLIRILNQFYPKNNYFLYNPKPAKTERFVTNEINVFERLPYKNRYRIFYNIWRQFAVISDLKSDKVTHFHGLSGELPFGLKNANIKSVVTIHDLIFIRYPKFYGFFDRKIHYYKFKKAAKSADRIIAISQQTKADIVSFLDVDEQKIDVIYQGCQAVFKEEYSLSEKNEVKQKYNLPPEFILNVGTIEQRKNVLSVVKAIENIDIHLVIIGGETPYKQEILAFITEQKIQHKIIFLQGLNSKELAIIYQLSTIFVYPSLFEGFGIPIIEALYSKIPVITTNNGVFPEAAGPDSVFVNPENISEIAEKIQLLLSNPKLRNEIAEKSYKFVQKFNDQQIANQIMEIYEKL
jgi:glycosyltransferase involved in cell wall biosynthesis